MGTVVLQFMEFLREGVYRDSLFTTVVAYSGEQYSIIISKKIPGNIKIGGKCGFFDSNSLVNYSEQRIQLREKV